MTDIKNTQNELEAIGKRLSSLLIHNNISRRMIADSAHCTSATIGRWTRGEAPYSFLILADLHNEFNIDLNQLICGGND